MSGRKMLKQTFALNNYSMYIQQDVLHEAQQLVQNNWVELVEVRDDIHVFQVKNTETESYEVEVQFARRKVRNYTCDCLEDRTGFCRHIAGALMVLDRKKQKETKQRRRSHKPSLKSLSTRSILHQVSDQELRQFLLQHAQLDERLAVALKTRFAHKIDLHEEYNHQKYYQLLRSFWKLTAAKRSVSAFKKLDRHLRELLALSEDLLAREDIREAYALLFGLQKFLMVGQFSQQSDVMRACETELCQQFVNLLGSEYSPKLKSRHFTELAELIEEGKYVPPDPALNLFLALFQFGDRSIRNQIEEKLMSSISLADEAGLQSLIAIFVQQEAIATKIDVFEPFFGKLKFFQLFFQTIKGTYAEEDFFDLAKLLYDRVRGAGTAQSLFQQVASILTDNAYQLEWHLTHFDKTHQFELLPIVKRLAGERWHTHQKKAEALFLAVDDFDGLVKLYAMDENNVKLMDLLAQQKDLERLLECAAHVTADHAKEVLLLVQNGFLTYLKAHVGYPSAQAVAEYLRTMDQSWLRRLVPDLAMAIRSEYGDRKLLIKSLAGQPL
ncbi:MAG: hypothetical protein KTR24_17795 [Saprospiraceae bacterium]|nr:hypothetical protein [Saprospiraceae bacterium]